MSNLINDPKGIEELKRAVNNIHEIQDYNKIVQESFRKGKKPPVKLSDKEKSQIQGMITKFELNKHSGMKLFNYGQSTIDNELQRDDGKNKNKR